MKEKVQLFGRFLSGMVMPNIGAFIAWGLITALFIETGWCPNERFAEMVSPMSSMLLPLLIAYTGGEVVAGKRGGVVGTIATMGVIVGSDIPMFIGAMIVGPLAAWVIKKFDKAIESHIPAGFEMLINNFSLGILGAIMALLAMVGVTPLVTALNAAMSAGVGFFVDHGLLRKNEGDEVEAVFGPSGPYDLNFIRVNAQQRFSDNLAGVEEPEAKRKIIGEEFIRVFEEEAKKIGAVDFLVQGTIYPDVIESGLGKSAVIKSHHNVGGLPDYVDFKEIIEPLRMLFKDEVRRAGLELGIPDYLVFRQPFPGPGLGIRIIGEVTEEKVKIVQDADAIYREEIAAAMDAGLIPKYGEPGTLGQYFAALTNMRSVGVMGDFRTYDYAVALRAVMTSDFMTAEAAHLPWEVIDKVTTRIVNEVKHVNRVVYDCTGKPPGTIEFE